MNRPITNMHEMIEKTNVYADRVKTELNNQLFLPEDGRWNVAAGMLMMGGLDASVLAIGERGGGKTEFGNIMLGSQYRAAIAPTDTYDTLFGYMRPTDDGFNEGKIKLEEANPVVHLSEVSHIETGAIHDLWDDEYFKHPDGRSIYMGDASIYATANFPDNKRSKQLDDAFRSRSASIVLAGDSDDAVSRKIQGFDISQSEESSEKRGLIVKADTRGQIRQLVEQQSPLSVEIGSFVNQTLKNLNNTGLFASIPTTEARIGRGWQQTARANRLINSKVGQRESINMEEYANVGALALAPSLVLSNAGKSRISEELEIYAPLSELQKAIICNRVAAQILYMTKRNFDSFPAADEEDRLRNFVGNKSYAQLDDDSSERLIELVQKSLHDNKDTENQVNRGNNVGKKRRFWRNS